MAITGKKSKKNKCKKKWISNIAIIVLPNNNDFPWYPYEMVIHHNLKDGDYDRRSCFCQWFLHQCNNQQFLATFLIGDKARIALNGTVNNHNVQMYAPAIQLTDFHIFFTISMIDNKNLLLG